MARKPRKNVGEIGATIIRGTEDGPECTIVEANLPTDKEQLEEHFATRFVAAFNQLQPLGDGRPISNLQQRDTSDLDFTITSRDADYLELAELNPRSEWFGTQAHSTGVLNVHQYASWIYYNIVRRKQSSYGQLSPRVMLVLFFTHWQFMPGKSVEHCLASLCEESGCNFAGLFVFLTDGDTLNIPNLIYPFPPLGRLPSNAYRSAVCENFEPGRASWVSSI